VRDVAKTTAGRKPATGLRLAALVVLLAATGCVGTRTDTAATGAPDGSLVTASIAVAQPTSETDPAAVGSAVAKADLGEREQGIPWANPATGSAGVISYVEEVRADSRTCRKFETSRHSYDGIALFIGETCHAPGKDWTVTYFGPKMPAPVPEAVSEG